MYSISVDTETCRRCRKPTAYRIADRGDTPQPAVKQTIQTDSNQSNGGRTSTMGLFSRTPRSIEPVSTHLDMAWFRTWVDGVIRDTGVDPKNPDNGIALLYMAGKSIFMAGFELMDKFGGAWAKPILDEYMNSDEATPWGAVELIAGWDRDTVPALERTMRDLHDIAVDVGPSPDGAFWYPK